jgi:cobyrinic acid a,c-diamide synthase
LFLLSGFLICHAVGWYESEFLQKLVKEKKIHEARAFNFTYRYIDDVLSINNSRFAEFLPVIDDKLQHTDHLFLGVACFIFLNFV